MEANVVVETIGWRLKAGYGLGHILNDLCASMWFTYLLLFLHKVLEFDNGYSGIIILVGQIADGLSTAFVGIMSDSGDDDYWLCRRVGRRKSWHLVGTLCVLISFPFLFLPCVGSCAADSDQSAQLLYYASFVIIFQFGWASVQISHLALIPELATSQCERTGLTAIRYAMTVISNIAVYAIAWGFLHGDTIINPSDVDVFRNVMIVVLSLGLLASIGFHVTVTPTEHGGHLAEHVSTVMTIKRWLCEPQLYQIAVVYLSTRLFVNLSQVYITLYLQITLQMPATSVATVPLVMFISGFATSLLMKPINKRIGRKATFGAGCLIGMAACTWVKFGLEDASSRNYIYGVAVIVGAGGSTMLVTSLSLTAEFISGDIKSSAFIYGLMSLTDKVSNGLAVVLIQYNVPPKLDTCVECRLYYRDVLFFGCGGAALLAFFAILTLVPFMIGSRRSQTQVNVVVVNSQVDESTPLISDN